MKKVIVLSVMVVLSVVNVASAQVIRGIDIDFVTIGNAGNAGDIGTEADPYNCGAVGYNYRIGKTEVTNAQWNAFTAAAGAPTGNPSNAYDQSAYWTGAQQPTNNASWYEAAQFCNYLTSGNKSLGAYQLGTDGSITVDRATAISAYGTTYVFPTEDEWYKAAYFKPDASGYSFYANGTDNIPTADNGWNYNGGSYTTPWNVGTGTQEQNGTFDMMGNVWEWNETLIVTHEETGRGMRGGSFYDGPPGDGSLSTSYQTLAPPQYEFGHIGFRIASVPEPCSLILISCGCFFLRGKRK